MIKQKKNSMWAGGGGGGKQIMHILQKRSWIKTSRPETTYSMYVKIYGFCRDIGQGNIDRFTKCTWHNILITKKIIRSRHYHHKQRQKWLTFQRSSYIHQHIHVQTEYTYCGHAYWSGTPTWSLGPLQILLQNRKKKYFLQENSIWVRVN